MDTIDFPTMGSAVLLEATDLDEREQFKFDIQRRGMKKAGKCTFQERYHQTEILVRVDIDGPPHDNPDGETIPCPHLHIYREGYADRWAVPLPIDAFSDPTNLELTLRHFLKYCHVESIPQVQRIMG